VELEQQQRHGGSCNPVNIADNDRHKSIPENELAPKAEFFDIPYYDPEIASDEEDAQEQQLKSAEKAFGMNREQLAARSAANRAIEDQEDTKYDNLRRKRTWKRWELEQEASQAQPEPAPDTPTGTTTHKHPRTNTSISAKQFRTPTPITTHTGITPSPIT